MALPGCLVSPGLALSCCGRDKEALLNPALEGLLLICFYKAEELCDLG